MQQVLGGTVGPALNTLLPRHLAHNDAQKIPAIPAFSNHLGSDGFCFKSGSIEQLGSEPGIHQPFLIAPYAQISKSRFQQINGIRFRTVYREIASREQHVIKQSCSRAATAQHKYRSFISCSGLALSLDH